MVSIFSLLGMFLAQPTGLRPTFETHITLDQCSALSHARGRAVMIAADTGKDDDLDGGRLLSTYMTLADVTGVGSCNIFVH